MLFSSRFRVRIIFSVRLVSGYAHVISTSSVITATLPIFVYIRHSKKLLCCAVHQIRKRKWRFLNSISQQTFISIGLLQVL